MDHALMGSGEKRLYFIDAIRAWAILMMLQGHFIDGLLSPIFRNPENPLFSIWLYFRGITAPVFFTVSGFIFTYLLLRAPVQGTKNPRIGKGLKRGLQLILIGYALRTNLFGLISGQLYDAFYLVDVLHCIGFSLIAIIALYLIAHARRGKRRFPIILSGITLLFFLFEPWYAEWSFSWLPKGIANYFTKANGSVFTLFPWIGYTTMGAAISTVFLRFSGNKGFYNIAIPSFVAIGAALIFGSSPLFMTLFEWTNWELFLLIHSNNYLFIRLGDVFLVFAIFMLCRGFLKSRRVLALGSHTLSIYVVHYIILYGSFTGLGLYRFFHHQLSPSLVIFGALLFVLACTALALRYVRLEPMAKRKLAILMRYARIQFAMSWAKSLPLVKALLTKIRLFIVRFLASSRG